MDNPKKPEKNPREDKQVMNFHYPFKDRFSKRKRKSRRIQEKVKENLLRRITLSLSQREGSPLSKRGKGKGMHEKKLGTINPHHP